MITPPLLEVLKELENEDTVLTNAFSALDSFLKNMEPDGLMAHYEAIVQVLVVYLGHSSETIQAMALEVLSSVLSVAEDAVAPQFEDFMKLLQNLHG